MPLECSVSNKNMTVSMILAPPVRCSLTWELRWLSPVSFLITYCHFIVSFPQTTWGFSHSSCSSLTLSGWNAVSFSKFQHAFTSPQLTVSTWFTLLFFSYCPRWLALDRAHYRTWLPSLLLWALFFGVGFTLEPKIVHCEVLAAHLVGKSKGLPKPHCVSLALGR